MGQQTKNLKKESALVLFSGGQDSTTCLVWALENFKEVHAIAFDYEQRHAIELKSAKKIAKLKGISLRIEKIELFKSLTKNALLQKTEIKAGTKKKLPTTFVDGRNIVFLTIAGIYAKQLNVSNLVTGVCETDYSGYPDCRNKFIKSIEKTLSLGMDYKLKIHTPLMWKNKAQTVKMMKKLGGIELLKYTHTCYEGRKLACGKCPACLLRLNGFKEANIKDSIKYEQ